MTRLEVGDILGFMNDREYTIEEEIERLSETLNHYHRTYKIDIEKWNVVWDWALSEDEKIRRDYKEGKITKEDAFLGLL